MFEADVELAVAAADAAAVDAAALEAALELIALEEAGAAERVVADEGQDQRPLAPEAAPPDGVGPRDPGALFGRQFRADRERRGRDRRRAVQYAREAEGFEPTDGLSWAAAPLRHLKTRLLTEADPRAPDPPGFRGRLFEPQRTLLAAMLALERRPVHRVIPAVGPDRGGDMTFQTKCARISERFSFGKTVTALALVLAQRVPARLPEICAVDPDSSGHRYLGPAAAGPLFSGELGFIPELSVRYARFLPLTVVAAAANIISQWEENARRFTDLRVFTIENVRHLRAFEALYRAGGATGLDLLFIKAGRVTANFLVGGEARPRGKDRSLFGALAAVLEGVPIARLIIDDFDTLRLTDDCFVPALFTWLVSATRRRSTFVGTSDREYPSVVAFLRARTGGAYPIQRAAGDDVLNSMMSLHCAPAYVNDHLSSTRVDYRRIYVRGGLAARALRALGVAEEVIVMVNAEAIGTAARALNIEAHSVGEVLRRVVGDKLQALHRAHRTLARVAAAREALAGLPPAPAATFNGPALRFSIKEAGDRGFREYLAGLTSTAPAAEAALSTIATRAQTKIDLLGAALTRMRDNIREEHCQVCCLPLRGPVDAADAESEEGAAYILSGCCQIIVCEACITRRRGAEGRIFIPRCPNCARDISVSALIRIGAEVDLSRALSDEALSEAAEEAGTGAELAEGVDEAAAEPAEEANVAAAEPAEGADVAAAEPAEGADVAAAEPAEGADVAAAGPAEGADGVAEPAEENNEGVAEPAEEADVAAAEPAEEADVAAAAPAEEGVGGAAVEDEDAAEAEADAVALAARNRPEGEAKLRALLQFIRGEEPECLRNEVVAPFIAGLLDGRRDIPRPANFPRRVLIFTMYPESTAFLRQELTRAGIPNWSLRGTRAKRDEAIRCALHEPPPGPLSVLLATEARDCAGLDLPSLTHVIYYHQVLDKNIEAQVAARGQRLGRIHNLEVVALFNEAEAAPPAL